MAALDSLHADIRKCRKCRLWKDRNKAVPGEGPPCKDDVHRAGSRPQ